MARSKDNRLAGLITKHLDGSSPIGEQMRKLERDLKHINCASFTNNKNMNIDFSFGLTADPYRPHEFYSIFMTKIAVRYLEQNRNYATDSFVGYFQDIESACDLVDVSIASFGKQYKAQTIDLDASWKAVVVRDVYDTLDTPELFVVIWCRSTDEDYMEEDYVDSFDDDVSRPMYIQDIQVKISGNAELVTKVYDQLIHSAQEHRRQISSSIIKWKFSSEHGIEYKIVRVTKDWEIYNEYYPWIEDDLQTYYKKFMASSSQILILFGPPGTGKTTFIKDLLCTHRINAQVTHDINILKSDRMYIEFLTDKKYDALVIEDADDLLTSGREDNDKIISKILNASDGLVKMPSKKLIFTTNLPTVGDIDPAIMRPGRCFDVMEFRQLSKEEAVEAGKKIGVNKDAILELGEEKYSLADIFSIKNARSKEDPLVLKRHEKLKKKLGFL
jgi:hypothetical protein